MYKELIISFAGLVVLLIIISIFILIINEARRAKTIQKLMSNFFENPSYSNLDRLSFELGDDYKDMMDQVYISYRNLNAKLESQRTELFAYRDIIELWAHEIKTPIAIIDLILDNHKSEMSPMVFDKITYANLDIKNNIDRILYYARNTSDKKDYKIREILIADAVNEALNKYYPVLAEEEIILSLDLKDYAVMSDYNSLVFIISQILSNSVKYTKNSINIYTRSNADDIYLIISNNGPKISDKDLPFIFEKGYTGDANKKTNSTGIGLYLAKSYADDLGIKINIIRNDEGNFATELVFYKN